MGKHRCDYCDCVAAKHECESEPGAKRAHYDSKEEYVKVGEHIEKLEDNFQA